MSLIFLAGFDVQLDPDGVALKRTSEDGSLLCGGAYGIIFGDSIFFARTCCLPDGFHKRVPWGGRHVCRKRVSL